MIEYTVRPGDSLDDIAARFARPRDTLLQLNPHLRRRQNRIRIGEIIVLPDAGDAGLESAVADRNRHAAVGASDPLRVPRGQLTFDAEGSDRPGPFFSRVLHVPSGLSGVTLGRGYDMRDRSRDQIEAELTRAGVHPGMAHTLRDASGLRGAAAQRFVTVAAFAGFEISHDTQKALFFIAYDASSDDVRRICGKHDVVARYGATDWDTLDARIRDVAVDLRYRGDYHPTSRQRVQAPMAGNNLEAFRAVMLDRAFWVAVPDDRFQRRCAYLA